jgi:hypothetical protein
VKRLRLQVSEQAARELREARTWWRENRAAAATAFVDDLRTALDLIRTHPGAGARASNVTRFWNPANPPQPPAVRPLLPIVARPERATAEDGTCNRDGLCPVVLTGTFPLRKCADQPC